MRRIQRLQQSLDSLLPSPSSHLRSTSPSPASPLLSFASARPHQQRIPQSQRAPRLHQLPSRRAAFHTASKLQWSSTPAHRVSGVPGHHIEVPEAEAAERRLEELRRRELDGEKDEDGVEAAVKEAEELDQVVDDVAEEEEEEKEEYVAATNWGGLEWVGGEEFVRRQERSVVGTLEGYVGFPFFPFLLSPWLSPRSGEGLITRHPCAHADGKPQLRARSARPRPPTNPRRAAPRRQGDARAARPRPPARRRLD